MDLRFAFIPLIFFSFLFFIGWQVFKSYKEHNRKKDSCIDKVEATVLKYEADLHKKTHVYTPIFEYEYLGEIHQVPYYRSTYKSEFEVGHTYTMYVNVDNEFVMSVKDHQQTYNKESMIILITTLIFMFLIVILIFASNNNDSFTKAIPLVLGSMFMVIAILVRNQMLQKKERCSYYTEAEITAIAVHRSTDSDGGTSVSYYPVYQYKYGDNTYEAQSDVSAKNSREFVEGQIVNIYLNPEIPEESFIESLDKTQQLVTKIFVIIGAALICVGIFLILSSSRSLF